ncbi:MAG: Smr/MutS family protein [Cocleimonas sp.]|nr:Smr/MutS family protein [Cocleimonas sp.]
MQKKQFKKAATPDYDDDFQLFRDAVQDITQIKQDKVHHQTKKVAKQKKIFSIEGEESIIDFLSDEAEVQSINPLDNLSYRIDGIQKRVFKKLRRGQYIIIDELDLHGLNINQAKKLLLHFLEIALQVEGSCVSIIHGKGHRSGDKEPVIKRQTNHWLKQHPRVLAFHSAQPKDGGTGAVYVLLRRTRLPE